MARRETIELDGTPVDEECAQVGEEGYGIRARAECQAYIRQIQRQFPNMPEGVSMRVKSSPHDYGSYYGVAVSFPEDDEKAADFAYMLEGEGPTKWDATARQELNLPAE